MIMVHSLMRHRPARVLVSLAILAVFLSPLAIRTTPAGASSTVMATQLMNWFPEPEHGGFWTAEQMKLYQKYGISVTLKPFSYAYSGLDGMREVALGKTTFAMANMDDVFNARHAGLPVVAIFATMQDDLQCFMWHASDTSIKTLADLSNHTIIYSFGATFWDYLLSKYKYTNIKTVNYNFTLQDFATFKNSVNQGYITEEPYNAEHANPPIPVKALTIGTAGYDPYYEVIVTSEDMIKHHPDLVKAYVQATAEGWKDYFASSATIEMINKAMRSDPTAKSFPLTAAAMTYSANVVKKYVVGGEAATHGIGYMDPKRITTLKQQLIGVGLKYQDVDPMATFTDKFLPATM